MAPRPLIKEDFWHPQNASVIFFDSLTDVECDEGCLECIDGGSTKCTRCEKGKYLAMEGNLNTVSFGECKDKT